MNPKPPFAPQPRASLDAYHAAETPQQAREAYRLMVAAGWQEYFDYGEGETMDDLSILPPEDQASTEDITTADGIFIKRVVVPKAQSWVPQHAHQWDHTTLLTSGSMFVWTDAMSDKVYALDRVYTAPAAIFIKAGVKHLFRTCEDSTTFFCIHNLKSARAVEILAEHDLLEEVI